MAQITWNNVAAPNLDESNSLFTQAVQSLKDAGIGLKDTAKHYQTVVRHRSHDILQDYINSANAHAEVQSESSSNGFISVCPSLASEYDSVKVNEYSDTRGNVLTKRAGDAVALKRNEFGLSQEQLAADKIKGTAELYALRNDPMAYAAKDAELAHATRLNRTEAQHIQLGPHYIKHANRADDYGNATHAAVIISPARSQCDVVRSSEVSDGRGTYSIATDGRINRIGDRDSSRARRRRKEQQTCKKCGFGYKNNSSNKRKNRISGVV